MSCPSCKSTAPKLHPAVQSGGEVRICSDPYHTPALAPLGDLPGGGKVVSYSLKEESGQTRIDVVVKLPKAPEWIDLGRLPSILDEFPLPARPVDATRAALARHRAQEAEASRISEEDQKLIGIDLRTPAHRDRANLLGIIASLAERLVYSRQEDDDEPYRCDICKETMPGFDDPPDAEEHHRGGCVIPAIKLLAARQ